MKTKLLLCLLPLAAFVISGCASESKASSDGRVHISYWEKWTGFEGEAMRAVVDGFNRLLTPFSPIPLGRGVTVVFIGQR